MPLITPGELNVFSIKKYLEHLDKSKAFGPDGISPRMLRHFTAPISKSLTVLYYMQKIEHLIYTAVINYLALNPTNQSIRTIFQFKNSMASTRAWSSTTQLVEFYHDAGLGIDAGGLIDCLFLGS